MFTKFANLFVLMLLVFSLNPTQPVQATPSQDASTIGAAPEVIVASAFDESRPLRSIDSSQAPAVPSLIRNSPIAPETRNDSGSAVTDTSIVQADFLSRSPSMMMPAAVTSFDGNGSNGYSPPDMNGDIGYSAVTGKKYYMQVVNTRMQIWDVTNPVFPISVYGPAYSNTLWSGFGGICETHNDGDPIVLFDHLANRWMFSQFAVSFPNNFHQCIAVSTSADPTGSWYRYDFLYSTTNLNDYPKFGVWPDGYYMSVNQFNGVTDLWAGGGVAVFDRAAMLNGLPATMIKFDLGAVVPWYGLMLPSDLDGPAPAAGTPNYFIEWDDSTWHDDPADMFRIWNFHVDWVTPGNSTFGTNSSFDPNAMIATADLDTSMCNGSRDCIPQPGTTQKVDAIAGAQLMHRLQYRNFGSYQTLVGNQTVDATGADKAGIYWFELRNSGGGWFMNQQGVYAPDGNHRWMGSAAMDMFGNVALGYSVSSSSTYPSVRYTGRLASDPPGTLPQGEASLVAGSGSQTGGNNRWGDYSMMTLDPTDDCTFWYTQEYYSSSSYSGWKTRIGSFRFPTCPYIISGNVTAAGAALHYTDGTAKVVFSDASGNYFLPVSSGWSGTVTPSLAGVTFTPANRSYNNVTSNLTGQNYTASVTLSGNAGVAGATLNYTGGSTVANGSGNYAFSVPYGWSGTVTPSLNADPFCPASQGYANLKTSRDGQNFAHAACPNFGALSQWTTSFDLSHGWTVKDYVRTVGDVNGDGRADLVGFGHDGVYVALSTGSGFGLIAQWTTSFDLSHGWTVQDYVRTVGDVNGDGLEDLVGFGLDGVYVATSTGSGFGPISQWASSFDLSHGWTVSQYVRTVGDVNGDGRDDLIGFGLDGVYVALALNPGPGFGPISQWTSAFDQSHGWNNQDHVRTVGDVNGDGLEDLVGFGLDGVYVATSTGSGFNAVSRWTGGFALANGWTVSQYVRTVGDVNGDGTADIVGFGQDGVYIGLSTGSTFSLGSRRTTSFDLSHGWTVSQYVRTVGDVNGGGKADLVGFGLDGVYISLSQ